jgi:hypothetical protein
MSWSNLTILQLLNLLSSVPEAKIWGRCKIFGCDDEMCNFGKLWISYLTKGT